MGPMLLFRGREGREWRLAATMLQDGEAAPEPLLPEGGPPVEPMLLVRHRGRSFWRYDFAVTLETAPRRAHYAIGARRWPVALPAADGPLRVAFTACNGTEGPDARPEEERNERWRHLAARHDEAPFHLLLHGGDQIYADSLWRDIPELAAWRRLPRWRRVDAPLCGGTAEAVRDYFFMLYRKAWSDAEVSGPFAGIPSLMMWDDHDIVDGWGSHSAALQRSPVFQGVWRAARESFALFQLGARPDGLPPGFARPDGGHFGWAYRVGHIGILAPDLRSQRTKYRVMGETGWADFLAGLDAIAGCRHLLLLSSVPAVHADPSPIERLLERLPFIQQHQDDLRDQWQSYAHHREWHRLLRALLDFGRETGAGVTALSGEIHLGALGRVRGRGAVLHQLISSGIVHPPPPWPVTAFFEWVTRRPRRLAKDLRMEMLPLVDGRRRYLAARNWLEIELPPDGGLQAVWYAEGREPLRFAA